MTFTATPKKENTEHLPCDIVVDGKVVGDLTPRLNCDGAVRWHACINLRNVEHNAGLLQGHGATHEEAIREAIKRGRRDAAAYARLTEEFAASVGFDGK